MINRKQSAHARRESQRLQSIVNNTSNNTINNLNTLVEQTTQNLATIGNTLGNVSTQADSTTINLNTQLDATIATSLQSKVNALETTAITDVIGINGKTLATKAGTIITVDLPSSVLTGVTLTSPTNNDVLQWNSTAWVNRSLSSAGISAIGHTHAIGNLTQSGATLNQVIQWNNSAWVPATISGGSDFIDGGFPSDNYSNIATIDGGTP